MSATVSADSIKNLQPFGIEIAPDSGLVVTELDRDHLLELARQHKIVLFRGLTAIEKQQLLQFCASEPQKELLHWDFGPVMEMKVTADPKNYLFSTERVPFHWDGAFHTVPSYLVFHCIEAPLADCGGETLFCNTELLWNDADPDKKSLWQSLELVYETEKKAHYGGRIQAPMVQRHPNMETTVLRYAEPVATQLNPVTMEVKGVDDSEGFRREMQQLIYSDRYCYQHQWRNGDLLIADNHALIHGRNAFTQNCPRHLRRIQIL